MNRRFTNNIMNRSKEKKSIPLKVNFRYNEERSKKIQEAFKKKLVIHQVLQQTLTQIYKYKFLGSCNKKYLLVNQMKHLMNKIILQIKTNQLKSVTTYTFTKYFILKQILYLKQVKNPQKMRPNFKLYHSSNKTINEISQSKEIDLSYNINEQKQSMSDKDIGQSKNQGLGSFLSNQIDKNDDKSQDTFKKYSTNQQTQTKYLQKLNDYNSGKFNSTQAASPYNRFSTENHFKQDVKSDLSSYSVKKQLFLQQKVEDSSPQFKLSESKYNILTFTFKKKVQQYPKIFGEKNTTQKLKTFLPSNDSAKISFQRINFSHLSKQNISKQNDSSQLNANQKHQVDLSSIKKKINFETINLQPQNPIIKRINEQIKANQQQISKFDKDYKISRRNQRDLVKKKILQSRSDMKRFYEDNSQNVQYEYRKAKFMDIFLGSKVLEHNIR